MFIQINAIRLKVTSVICFFFRYTADEIEKLKS